MGPSNFVLLLQPIWSDDKSKTIWLTFEHLAHLAYIQPVSLALSFPNIAFRQTCSATLYLETNHSKQSVQSFVIRLDIIWPSMKHNIQMRLHAITN